MGWGRLAKEGVEVKMVPGAHHNMLEQPHVATLAAKLKESLTHAQEQAAMAKGAAGDRAEL
jgi:thioesterase domain-containing protein